MLLLCCCGACVGYWYMCIRKPGPTSGSIYDDDAPASGTRRGGGGEGDEGAAGWNEMNPAAKAAKAEMDDDEEEGLARAKDDDPHNMDL